jgi:hypothetical protein
MKGGDDVGSEKKGRRAKKESPRKKDRNQEKEITFLPLYRGTQIPLSPPDTFRNTAGKVVTAGCHRKNEFSHIPLQ